MLRVKRGVKEHCREFKSRDVLAENEWKTVREFEGTLRETSRLATMCQNEDNLNDACGLEMIKALCDSLDRDTMKLIDVENWSTHKEMVHPTRSEANVDSFAETGKACRTRALLECESRFFDNKTE